MEKTIIVVFSIVIIILGIYVHYQLFIKKTLSEEDWKNMLFPPQYIKYMGMFLIVYALYRLIVVIIR